MGPGRLRATAAATTATVAVLAAALSVRWGLPGDLTDRVAVALVITAYAVTATVIVVARPGNRVGRLILLGTTTWAVGELLLAWGVAGWVSADQVVAGASVAAVLGTALRGTGWLVLVLGVPLVFPDGRTAWPAKRAPARLMLASVVLLVLGSVLAPYPLDSRMAHLRSPTGLPTSWQLVADALAVSALILALATLLVAVIGLRIKWRAATALEHQQLAWFALAFAVPALCLPLAATPWAPPWLFAVASAPVPVAIAVALLQRRLYDIDLVLSRSLTYVLVTGAAVAVYAGTIAAVGILLRRPDADWLPWVGGGVLALAFTPMRQGLQSVANRVTYGHWSAPAEVLSATERRLRDATDLQGLLDAMVTELATLLRLPDLVVTDRSGQVVARGTYARAPDRARSPGRSGPGPDATEALPLMAYGATVGTMRWARTPLGAGDRRLLGDIGRQVAEALRAAGLVEDLRRAQERLVLAREEERKRLRRDLHDGLGPTLAALVLDVDRLRDRVGALAPDQADRELVLLRTGIQRALSEVRHVVEGLRPPALDELGLATAVHHLARRVAVHPAAGEPGTHVEPHVEIGALPELPAATEVAAYRIAQEALTNVVRHAGAHHAWLGLTCRGDELVLVVRDDGSGVLEPREGGVGLTAMRERAAELGGTLTIDARPASGTTVTARLPLAASAGRTHTTSPAAPTTRSPETHPQDATRSGGPARTVATP
ncbi:sensor histidine kinase [Ornithinimicrobium cavernae]|uniref:sensor histidine kinase n=1 Tax=Ornithinimicrobium cavernae TaxID=2666047 RepID=UPI000D68BBC6|nr:sensor histidine kinase [Ornithinimicrobium cavernae]